jgi:hypothetical protein
MDSQIIIGRGTASGTNNYVVTLSVAVDELHNGNVIYITFTNGNNGAADINPNGIGVLDITDQFGDPLQGGEITDGCKLELEYNLANDNLRIISNASTGNIARVRSVIRILTQEITVAVHTWTDLTGLSITMTPSKASDTFLIQAALEVGNDPAESSFSRVMRIVDPAGTPVETPIGIGTASGSRTQATGDNYSPSISEQDSISFNVPDAPNTTLDVLYKIQVAKAGFDASSVFINRSFDNVNNANRSLTTSSLIVWQLN